MGTNNKTNDCMDVMIWVGTKSPQRHTIDEFIEEAQLRGCCRRMPFVYGWMKFGKTKIFLAGKGEHKKKSQGSLFGYYILNRIEIITEHKIVHSLLDKKKKLSLWPCNTQYYVKCLKIWKKKKLSEPKIRSLLRELLQKKHILDIAHGETCKKPSFKSSEKKFMDLIEKMLEELIGKWLDVYDKDIIGRFPCDCSVKGEGRRWCGIRKKKGSVYAVDALCATVHDKYRQLLRDYLYGNKMSWKDECKVLEKVRKAIWKLWLEWLRNRKKNKSSLQDLFKVYKWIFADAVEISYKKWTSKYPLDPQLKGKATICGELVVFNKPFPTLERAPKAASFKGVWRIDGNELIEQIANRPKKKKFVVRSHSCK